MLNGASQERISERIMELEVEVLVLLEEQIS